MDDLKNIFEQTTAEIENQANQAREEGKKILKEKGIREIFEYVISIINEDSVNLDGKVKIIQDRLYYFAREIVDSKYEEYHKPFKMYLEEEASFKDPKIYGFTITANCGFSFNLFQYTAEILTASCRCGKYYDSNTVILFGSKNVIFIRRNNDNVFIKIEEDDSKEVIAQKIIKLIMNE